MADPVTPRFDPEVRPRGSTTEVRPLGFGRTSVSVGPRCNRQIPRCAWAILPYLRSVSENISEAVNTESIYLVEKKFTFFTAEFVVTIFIFFRFLQRIIDQKNLFLIFYWYLSVDYLIRRLPN